MFANERPPAVVGWTLRLEDAAALLPGVPDCAGPLPGTFQLWPHRHTTDAMFGALLRRVGG